jgi:glutathione S-transferase
MADPALYQLHGFDVSYFTAKVRCALRYKRLWYEERRADIPEILRLTGLGFIPIVTTQDGEVWQDSTDIYDRLEARHPDPPLFPTTPVQRMVAHLVELYVDEVGLIPAMHYRWGSELGESTARARFSAMMGSDEAGNRAADRMVKARYALGATPEAGPTIEKHTHALLTALSGLFGVQPYLLGERMSFADCALMGPFYAHLWNDLVSRQLLLETARPVIGWIERCNFPNTDQQGEWRADPLLGRELHGVLEVMGRDGAPVVENAVRAVEEWADTRPADLERLPRAVATCTSRFGGGEVTHAARPYTLLSLQRVTDAYAALDGESRALVDGAVRGTGWEPVLAYTPRHRMARDGFELAFEPGSQD